MRGILTFPTVALVVKLPNERYGPSGRSPYPVGVHSSTIRPSLRLINYCPGDPQVCPNWSKFQLGANRYSLESQQVHRGGNHGQHIMRTQHTLFISYILQVTSALCLSSYRSCQSSSSSRQSVRLRDSVQGGVLHYLRAPSNGVAIFGAIHPSAIDRVGSRIPTRRLPTS